MLKGKKAVIFDLDGTLIDSLGIWSAVDELLVTSLGRPDLAADPVTLGRLREDALGARLQTRRRHHDQARQHRHLQHRADRAHGFNRWG